VMREVRNYEFAQAREDDCILMGDLNIAPNKMSKLQSIGGVLPLINNLPTNVRETEIYDNILIEPQGNQEYTGRSGVLSMKEMFQIETKDALRLSDHNPVWAEFWIEERGYTSGPSRQIANQIR
jgi:deoxyribonuclease-1-like protein